MTMGNRQTFVAENMAQAMIALKAALGPHGVPISSRKVRRGGFMGFGSREYVEVVGERLPAWLMAGPRAEEARASDRRRAADNGPFRDPISRVIEAAISERKKRARGPAEGELVRQVRLPRTAADTRIYNGFGRVRSLAADEDRQRLLAGVLSSVERQQVALESGPQIENIRQEIGALKREMKSLLTAAMTPRDAATFSGPFRDYYERLQDAGLDETVAGEIVDRVRRRSEESEWDDQAVIRARLVKEITGMIKIAPALEPEHAGPRLIAAVGATGVGKTTTLAKLGAVLMEEEGRSIAYVTLDNYRIGGAEQLQDYCHILGVPCAKAANAAELREFIDQNLDREYIFVDTAGRSPYRTDAVADLRRLLGDTGHDFQLLLFVAASTEPREMEKLISTYALLDGAHLVFTKVDETARWGALFMAAARAQMPIAYLTTGQSVPDDIEPAIGARIADALLAGGEARA